MLNNKANKCKLVIECHKNVIEDVKKQFAYKCGRGTKTCNKNLGQLILELLDNWTLLLFSYYKWQDKYLIVIDRTYFPYSSAAINSYISYRWTIDYTQTYAICDNKKFSKLCNNIFLIPWHKRPRTQKNLQSLNVVNLKIFKLHFARLFL